MRYRIAIGPNQGQKTLTLRYEALIRTDTKPQPNGDHGFSLRHHRVQFFTEMDKFLTQHLK